MKKTLLAFLSVNLTGVCKFESILFPYDDDSPNRLPQRMLV